VAYIEDATLTLRGFQGESAALRRQNPELNRAGGALVGVRGAERYDRPSAKAHLLRARLFPER